MMIFPMSSRAGNMLLSFICFALISHHGNSLSFSFDFSDTKYKNSLDNYNITTEGDAFYNNGHLSISADSQLGINGSIGRVIYKYPMPLWNNKTGEVTNFTTNFSVLIQNTTGNNFGDGLAFFLSPNPKVPPDSMGGALGLFNYSIALNASANQIVAVEFDTFYNPSWDPYSSNPTDCHIGIDVNQISSTAYKIIPNSIFVGKRMSASINYNSATKNLSLYLYHEDDPTINFNLNAVVDFKNLLPTEVWIGFSASTGTSIELHQINSWSFNSTLEVASVITDIPKKKFSIGIIVSIIAGTSLIVLFLVGFLVYHLRKKVLSKAKNQIEMGYGDMMEDEFEKGSGPTKFSYSELAAATDDFADDKKLGEGGFGPVYRGILSAGTEVAIKKISKGSKQGMKEYISEVKIISRLRHRNLVQLKGWCHEHGDFLLVYELMHNGSLDTHLYNPEVILTWSKRHKIGMELGYALFYLHTQCAECVVHRDIKPSNIMLDSFFNAKLGDFGLARLMDHEADSQPTIPAGTMGYMAPECVMTGTTSSQSDIYSFGIVLLEITCGRSPIVHREDQNVRLIEWVWDLYGSNSILEAVDKRLEGEIDERQAECLMVVGLWCAHPLYTSRPSIQQAMSALNFEAPLPILPLKMPVPTYPGPIYTSTSSYTSSVGTATFGTSSTSNQGSTSSSSDSTWLLKQSITK